ncbi:SpoVR family protein [Halopelagius longus]|uniref:AbrB family transcriptional regulator n=1 Tax=Halopelagius longus TaxID=1236180 RepID=A0A1H0Z916_9EURY|nr:SpoVR family protein [Halopelagius longus]RDI72891.1 AbrB family transcriptional regulator [Halopelagius longus]SDQ23947.1 stage V sporulation protein R [Halopelagius longus]
MSTKRFRLTARREAESLEEPVEEAGNLARKLGLEPYPVNYWVVDHDEMNQLIAYGGFQRRYPHWRWGMTYDRQRKQDQFGMGKAFEIVNNDNPSHAFLQESNSLADQKAVITHVEAHADFFRNNEWFGMFVGDTELDAAAMLERHGEAIQKYMEDPEIDREEVEKFIDAALCLEDTIDQHRTLADAVEGRERVQPEDLRKRLDDMDISSDVRRQVFDEEWLDDFAEAEAEAAKLDEPRKDVLAFVRQHGMRYDEEEGKAVEMEPWQKDVLDMLRTEAYYFAAQKMTKVMNEGWAAYWESLMMGEEQFAGTDEFITYADHQARVLGSPGLNPYKLGKELWEYIENTTNRAEVADKLLRVKGVTWRNFHEVIDFDEVQELIQPNPAIDAVRPETLDELAELDEDDPRIDWSALDAALSEDGDVDVESYPWKVLTYEGLAERHFSLVKPQNRGFLRRIRRSELEQLSRYMFDDEQYDTVEEALADVDYAAGWDRMREIRESHNDVTFLDAFLTQEFVTDNNYFTYEFTRSTDQFRVASVDYEDVKKKLLLQFTNFGKPTIAVYDGNFHNRNELLLGHQYNGIMLDVKEAKGVLERLYDIWGRPVNLMTIVKEFDEHEVEVARRRNREPVPKEVGKRIRYDGSAFETYDLDPELEERIQATDIDYDTKPDEWQS